MGKSARVTVYEAARLLEVSHSQIYKAINGKLDKVNPLQTYPGGKTGRTKLVDLEQCRKYLINYAPRVKIANGSVMGRSGTDENDSEWNLRDDESIEDCINRCLRDGAPKFVIEKLTKAAEAIRRQNEFALKAAAMVTPAEASKMLRSLGDLYVQEVDTASATFANELDKFLRENFSIDLVQKNITAPQMLESFHRCHSDRVIERIRAEVEKQIKGVSELELS